MTRINSSIPVHSLTDEHLIAEHREIKRLPFCFGKAMKSGSIKQIPEQFVLGKGHVLFFLNKQRFVYKRYCCIFEELMNRGFRPSEYHFNWKDLNATVYWNDYTPTDQENNLLVERIKERILNSKKKCWHYYGKQISKEKAVELLTKNEILI